MTDTHANLARHSTGSVALEQRHGQRRTRYANDNDRLRHLAYIAAIAQENHRPIPEMIANCCERILSDLQRHARAHDYLNVFVAKRVFEHLKRSE